MRVMSVSGFSDWEKGAGVREFIFDSDNNSGALKDCFHVCLRFPSVAVSRTTSRIAFRNGPDCLYLDRVKEVKLYDEYEEIGAVFDVVCKDPACGEISWRFLAY